MTDALFLVLLLALFGATAGLVPLFERLRS